MRIDPTVIFNDDDYRTLSEASRAWGLLQTEAEQVAPEPDAALVKQAEATRVFAKAGPNYAFNQRQVGEGIVAFDTLWKLCRDQAKLPDNHWIHDQDGKFPEGPVGMFADPKAAVVMLRENLTRAGDLAGQALLCLQEGQRVLDLAAQQGTDAVYRVWPIGWDTYGWKVQGMRGIESGPYRTHEEAEYAAWSEAV